MGLQQAIAKEARTTQGRACQDAAGGGKGDLSTRALKMAGSNSALTAFRVYCRSLRDRPGRPQQPAPSRPRCIFHLEFRSSSETGSRAQSPVLIPSVPPNLLGDQQHQEAQERRSQGAGAAPETPSH